MPKFKAYAVNLFRPWKLVTFLMGTAFFVWGAYFWSVPTWDVENSILMSVLCYLFAPWAVANGIDAVRTRPKLWVGKIFLSIIVIYFVGSGSYEIYHLIQSGHRPLTYWQNFFFSIPLTLAAGWIWQFDGTLRELVHTMIKTLSSLNRSKG